MAKKKGKNIKATDVRGERSKEAYDTKLLRAALTLDYEHTGYKTSVHS